MSEAVNYKADLAVKDPIREAYLRDFIAQPSLIMHEGWLSRFPHATILRRLKNVRRSAESVSAFILKELDADLAIDDSQDIPDLVLLGPAKTEQLALLLGLSLEQLAIKSMVQPAKQRMLLEAVGKDQMQFVFQVAPFLAKDWARLAEFSGDAATAESSDALRASLIRTGMRAIWVLLEDLPFAIKIRFALSIDPQYYGQQYVPVAMETRALLEQIATKLIRRLP